MSRPLTPNPHVLGGLALTRGSDPRGGARQSEDLADTLHTQRGSLARLPAQGPQAQEAVWQVLHHSQCHGLAQVTQPPREHD